MDNQKLLFLDYHEITIKITILNDKINKEIIRFNNFRVIDILKACRFRILYKIKEILKDKMKVMNKNIVVNKQYFDYMMIEYEIPSL